MNDSKKLLSVKNMAKISILSVIAFLLMQIEFPVPIFPAFLKIDLSDLPALIGGFALGPVVGILIELFKNLMHLMRTSTSGVGELANFLVGISLVVPASIIYFKDKTKKNAIIGLIIGTIIMGIVGGILNYFILLPFYANVMKFPMEAIINMGTIVNKHIIDVKTLILYAVIPFNIFKGFLISVFTMLVYKRISRLL
ncbi:MAG: ECF transporter S component [Bacillota bacterium]|nr:ECF transporter S component [Bacillota bacterium]